MGNNSLFRTIRLSPLSNSRLYHLFRYCMYARHIDSDIAKHAPGLDKTSINKSHIRRAAVKYHWDVSEYFLFDYENIDDEHRAQFVPEYDKNVFCEQVNDPVQAAILANKWETYLRFKPFFKRDAVLLKPDGIDSEEVAGFVDKHNSFIMKCVASSLGRGISIVRADSAQSAIASIREEVARTGSTYILEELISQSKETAEFHEKSVNTLRIRTFRRSDKVEVFYPLMRFGTGGDVVDNAGHGGIFAIVDVESGKTVYAGDKMNRQFSEHPDSGKPLVGVDVPRWDEAVSLAKELAKVLPDVHYVGWDLALTDNGWVMVEGNDKAQLTSTQLYYGGIKPMLKELKKNM